MTHPTTPAQPHPDAGYRPASTPRFTVRIVAAVLATITATLALAWFIIAATAAPAHADALCDAMRARFGPGYPCISVPTNTFTPTAPAGPTTTNPGGQSSGGPQVGIDTGPGPGVGNGTPIVPVPGGTNAAPGTNPAPATTPTTPQIPANPTQPARQTAQPAPSATPQPPAATAPARQAEPDATTPAPRGTSGPTHRASIPTSADDGSDQTTQMLWLLAGAAAIIAGASTARGGGVGRYRAAATANGYPTVVSALRSWLPGGGSERAHIGNSQYVLINDPTSPKSYVFHEHVPPGGHITVNPDGTATIYNRNGRAVSTIAKPWAYDSLGRPQHTWYTVDNNGDLVQHIDPEPNALYPILADPTNPYIPTIQGPPLQTPTAPPPPPVEQSPIADSPAIAALPSLSEPAPPDPSTLPPVEQSPIADSPAITALPDLSEPADPPDPSTLPPVDESPIADSPAITALPDLSEPADPPDPSTLPPVEQSPLADNPAINALPTLSGSGEPGSKPDTIVSDGLIWTRISPDPSVFPSGLPEGQSFWTTTVDNRTITVQTIANPDGTTTVISNGVLHTYDKNGNLLGTFAPDPGQALADPTISLAATGLVVAARGGAGQEALTARSQYQLFKTLNRILTPSKAKPPSTTKGPDLRPPPKVDNAPLAKTLEDALRGPKLDHVFVPKHKLGNLQASSGGREGAMRAIVRSLEGGSDLPTKGPFEVVRMINAESVTIRGAVVNGIIRIGTVFIP